jgi:hypothetical protein
MLKHLPGRSFDFICLSPESELRSGVFLRGASLNAWRLSPRKDILVNGLEIAGGWYTSGEIKPMGLYIYEELLPGEAALSHTEMSHPLPDHFL